MHFVNGKHGRAVALVSGLACCLVVGVGLPAQAQPRNGPSAREVAEARSKAVERSKQLGVVATLLTMARIQLRGLTSGQADGVTTRTVSYGDPSPYGDSSLYGDPGPYGDSSSYADLDPYEAPNPYADPGAYDAPGPYADLDTYDALNTYDVLSPYDDPRPYDSADAHRVPGPYADLSAYGDLRGAVAARADRVVVRQVAEVRRLEREHAQLRQEADAARATADRLAREREAVSGKTRGVRARARHGKRKAAATARPGARDAAARDGQEPSLPQTVTSPSTAARGDIVADWALTQIDKPYVWASAGPAGYDCSGLTMQAWARVGVKMDHWTGTQWTSGQHVPLDQLHRGDLLFFGRRTRKPADIRHVGIYIGRGMMVHAPQTGDVVRVAPMWRKDLIGATRPA
ncbi:C40 family peptidase [Streptosporangium carneum]|uniref:NlpC/P60 domain-containing protein n=1 Tax=Streptosporangium carneum TaxID=47481 RepID=A0A9W6HVV5_9ACTN|nr:C40 family peptidase [Streptosporangium carneum]GLK06659.1 hypothetical protein GCM10017600_00640 [Streptosporangium carneum]